MLPFAVLIFVLLVCSAFFSSSETALFSLSDVDVHKFKESRSSSAKKIVAALKNPRDTLVTVLLGNELVNISMSIATAAFVDRLVQADAKTETLIAVCFITPFILVFGEILPKNVSFRYASALAQFVVWPVSAFKIFVFPLRIVLTWFADRIVKLLGGGADASDRMIMEEEYRRLVDMGNVSGTIVDEEKELIHNVFEFTDKVAKDIMTPERLVFMMPVDASCDRLVQEIRSVQYSRIPFYEGQRSNVVGVLHVRDLPSLYKAYKAGGECDVRSKLKPAILVDPATPLETLLREFQSTQMHMAFVMEKGRLSGLVTMGDVLEELFGHIEG